MIIYALTNKPRKKMTTDVFIKEIEILKPISVTLKDSDKSRIKALARKCGQRPTEWMREALLAQASLEELADKARARKKGG